MSFVEDIYGLTKKFPEEEKYGLTAQLRRASVSIPSNISEGAARNSKKEFEHFTLYRIGISC
ncbi:four helix bundle protein [Prosthecochloris sp.]|uniref:four helix bundle protein n=1 Tax=Prosthecochloris sp. TaxID=290513 RepID=UPI003450EA74